MVDLKKKSQDRFDSKEVCASFVAGVLTAVIMAGLFSLIFADYGNFDDCQDIAVKQQNAQAYRYCGNDSFAGYYVQTGGNANYDSFFLQRLYGSYDRG